MAFLSKFGGIMKQGMFVNGNVPVASTVNFSRAMSTSTSKLFVGGLSWGTSDDSLRTAFENFGQVTEARVITDRETGRSRGFGFVSFDSGESANSAMSAMDGQELDGRPIRVNLANERPPRSFDGSFRGGFNAGGDAGGY